MTRNIFIVLSVIGCGVLIPVNLIGAHDEPSSGDYSDIYVFVKLTPQFIYGGKFWAFVVLAYVFNGVIYYFLWRNYRAITNLRRTYFQSSDYRNSLHSRTLLITHIPSSLRTDEGIVSITQEVKTVDDIPNTSIGRNVKDLPELIEEHEETVHELEKVLASYLANPNKLPQQRPLCKPSKHDKARARGQKVDAIDYLTSRIRRLELEVNEARESVDRRNPLAYGFASYTQIEDAHAIAYATRKKAPHGTTVKLAPKPHDLIWKNLPMTRAARKRQSVWNSLWMILLTVLFIPPNVLIAVFLANLHNLGQVWKGFGESLLKHPIAWSIAQGIIAPGIQLLFYFFLPTIFRRLLVRAGDTTKTARERHVTSKLYTFFVFNNLFIFSIFATAWAFIATAINARNQNVWEFIKSGQLGSKIVVSLCNISPYWITWQTQRTLGAAIDIVQAWPLISNWFLKQFTNPTPRQRVELTAPQPFIYADYYNNYLFVATVGLAYGSIQPLILPVTAIYIAIDSWLKKYMLQYICITKIESGGALWRMVFNRFLFATLLMDAIIALLVGTKGVSNTMLYAMIPLLPIFIGFKWYCARTFDTKFNYHSTHSFAEAEVGHAMANITQERKARRADRVGVRFGHPALYKKLITPMVYAKSQHLLKEIYRGRLDGDAEVISGGTGSRPNSIFGYSDIYMSQMNSQKPGKLTNNAPFEVVQESDLDFGNYKRRSDFRDQFGGDGELYGRPDDMLSSRPGTPSSMMSFGGASTLIGGYNYADVSRDESPAGGTRPNSRPQTAGQDQTTYARGYANIPLSTFEDEPRGRGSSSPHRLDVTRLDSIDIPTPGLGQGEIGEVGHEAYRDNDQYTYHSRRGSQGSMAVMLENAGEFGRYDSPTRAGQRVGGKPVSRLHPQSRQQQYGYLGGPGSTGLITPDNTEEVEPSSYDYFRRGRGRDA